MISRSVLATNDRFPFTGRKIDVGGEAKAVHRVDGHLAGGIEIFFIGSDAPEPDADAGQAAAQLAAEGLSPQVICLDPPRKGCDAATLDAVLAMAPRRVVMVSCNAATAARDCRYLADRGYRPVKVQPVDLFPRTKHVECVVLLSKLHTD